MEVERVVLTNGSEILLQISYHLEGELIDGRLPSLRGT